MNDDRSNCKKITSEFTFKTEYLINYKINYLLGLKNSPHGCLESVAPSLFINTMSSQSIGEIVKTLIRF